MYEYYSSLHTYIHSMSRVDTHLHARSECLAYGANTTHALRPMRIRQSSNTHTSRGHEERDKDVEWEEWECSRMSMRCIRALLRV